MTENKRVKNRRDTALNWTTNNPVLLAGEFGVEMDTRKLKVGDGVTAWNDLEYCSGYTEEEITAIITDTTYTKNEIDSKLDDKADASDVYTKTQVDSIKSEIEGEIPTKTSDLTNNSGFITSSDIPAQQQADWTESDPTSPSYIQHKPSMPSAQIQSDWNQNNPSEVDYIKNKPTIPTKTSDLTNDSGFITENQVLSFNEIPSGWDTAHTMADLIADIDADTNAVIGKSYRGTVSMSDLPGNLLQGELQIDIMEVQAGLGKNIRFTLTSSNTAPYHWEYESAWSQTGTWRGFVVDGSLATVATTGSYTDLSDKPSIPAAQVNADWNASSGVAQILNKPTIPAAQIQSDWNQSDSTALDYIKNKPNVSFTQQQADWNQSDNTAVDYIKNKPSIPAAQVNSDWNSNSGVSEILNKPTIPTKTSDLTNDSDFITSSDIPAQVQSDWTESDSTSAAYIQHKPSIPAAQVNSDWNSNSGVSEILNKPTIPTKTSDLTNDSNFITANDVPSAQTQADWTESDPTDPAYIKNKPNIPSGQVQSDWNQSDNTAVDYIKNKPTIPAAPVQSNWNESDNTSLAYIQNKPNIPAAQIQSDWNQSDNTAADFIKNKPTITAQQQADWNQSDNTQVDYIKNKPTIPAAQVNSDWNSNSGVSQILNKPSIPANTSDLTNDSGFITLNDVPAQVNADWNSNSGASQILNKPTVYTEWFGTQAQYDAIITKDQNTIYHIEGPAPVQSNWNESDNTSLAYIQNKPTIPAAQIQSDWNQSDNTAVDYIKNKPSIPAAQVQANWNESDSTSMAYIQNKPNIPTVNDATLTINQGGVLKGTFTANASSNVTIDLDAGGGGTQVQSDWNQSDNTAVDYIKNKPTIPAAQVQSNWNESDSTSAAYIQNKPTIPTVPSYTTETWTFTLSDQSTVTKTVYLVPSV